MKDHTVSKLCIVLYSTAALLFSVLCTYLCVMFCSVDHVDLSMNVKLHSRGTVKIFYLEKENHNWSEKRSVETAALDPGKEYSVLLRIPVKKLTTFRLDFQNPGSGENIINDLELAGQNGCRTRDVKIKSAIDIKGIRQQDHRLTVLAGSKDPYIIFQLPETLHSKNEYDIFLAGIVFSLSLMIFMGFGVAVLKMQKSKYDVFDLLLVSAVLVMLCIPVIKIDESAVSVKENRALAKFPDFLNTDGMINTQFGQQFDSYFNDRFLGRDLLVTCYQNLKNKVNILGLKYAVSSSVVEGKDGWFFYCLENSIRNYQNLDVFTEAEMQKSLSELQKIANWCKQNNMNFYYFIAPDKNRIYGEYMTFVPKVYPDSQSRANLWVNYIRNNSDIKVLYPSEELIREKSRGLLYYKSDTHWNKLGSYVGYLQLMKLIKKDYPAIEVFQYTKLEAEPERRGDLYNFMPDIIGIDSGYFKPDLPKHFSPSNIHTRRRHYFKNPQGKYKAFVIRDSFANDALPYLHASFKEVCSDWQFTLKKEDLIQLKQQQNNVVILLHVERNLPTVFKDLHKTTTFSNTKE